MSVSAIPNTVLITSLICSFSSLPTKSGEFLIIFVTDYKDLAIVSLDYSWEEDPADEDVWSKEFYSDANLIVEFVILAMPLSKDVAIFYLTLVLILPLTFWIINDLVYISLRESKFAVLILVLRLSEDIAGFVRVISVKKTYLSPL